MTSTASGLLTQALAIIDGGKNTITVSVNGTTVTINEKSNGASVKSVLVDALKQGELPATVYVTVKNVDSGDSVDGTITIQMAEAE